MKIQWFPGHMHKTKLALAKLVKEVDIVIELLDARAPLSSCNPLIQNIIKHKKQIKILNKHDLADETITNEWIKYFKTIDKTIAITGNMNDVKQARKIINLCKRISPARNSFEKPLRVMVTGIPNVGKSTLINQLLGRKIAKTGDVPALTKNSQCIVLDSDFIVYDTPGITWENIDIQQIGFNLAICNSIGRNAIDEETLALYLINFLIDNYKEKFFVRFKLDSLISNPYDILLGIGKKRGCLFNGGEIDIQKTSELIIQDFRNGSIGKITLETPNIWEQWKSELLMEVLD